MTVSRRRLGSIARRILKYGGLGLFGVCLAGAVAVYIVVARYEAKLPSVEQLKKGYTPPQVTRVLARDGTLLGSIFTERRTVISFSTIPSHVKLAFLAAEDATFYEHEGLNYFGMLRALVANLRAGETRQGASTITQQVVKNLFLTPERTYERKIKETILARRLEQELSKDEIFSLYMNHIYLGHGRYGVEEAARYYFGRHTGELDLAQASLLAGLVAAPERFSPRTDPERALARKRYVLLQMLDKGFVTRPLFEQALDSPLRLVPSSEEESELAPEAVAYARRFLENLEGDRAKTGGYVIHTTIEPRLQAAARQVVRQGLESYATRQKLSAPYTLEERRLWGPRSSEPPQQNRIYVGRVVALDDEKGRIDVGLGDAVGRVLLSHETRYDPKQLRPSQLTSLGAALRVSVLAPPEASAGPVPLRLELGPEAALVAIDVRSREVRALVGSHEALPGGLDRATQSSRQPGSAFKAFVYGYALASRRFTPASVLTLPPDPSHAPPDAPPGPRSITLRQAIARSDNAAAEYLLEQVGAPNVIQWARAVGIESRLQPTPSLALGAYEVTPLELCNAYASFASGGQYQAPKLIAKVVGPEGKELLLPPAPPTRQAISPEEAYLTTSLLSSVVEVGTGRRAKGLGRPLAGKTGTTNRARDAWFVGFSTEIVASVWVGYDDGLPLGWGESGAVSALPIWMDFMRVAHEGHPVTDFPRPPGIVRASIDPVTGLLAYPGQQDAVEEDFLDGSVPTDTAAPHVEAPEVTGLDDEALAGGVAAPPAAPNGAAGHDGGPEPPDPPPAPVPELPPF